MLVAVVLVVVGLVALARGADAFVVSASRLASAMRLSPVVIGAVIVGFGTGVPELLVSGSAAARGTLDIAVGNIIGSNLANLTLVLGVAGLMARPTVVPRVLRREAPLSLAAVALLAVLVQNGLTRIEGVVLVVALVAFVVLILRATQPDPDDLVPMTEAAAMAAFVEQVEELVDVDVVDGATAEAPQGSVRKDLLKTMVGLIATVAGAQALVAGAQDIAATLGFSGGFVGLTLVAGGTSLPELVTAIQSARRNETALLVGNVLGSNVFNSTAVAGTAALIGPSALDDPGLTVVATVSMVLVALLAWLFLGLGGRLRRWESVVLLTLYAATIPLSL